MMRAEPRKHKIIAALLFHPPKESLFNHNFSLYLEEMLLDLDDELSTFGRYFKKI